MAHERRRRNRWTTWVTVGVVVLAAYVLSVGPAAWCVAYFGPQPTFVDESPAWGQVTFVAAYAPLATVASQTDVTRAALSWYIELFTDRVGISTKSTLHAGSS